MPLSLKEAAALVPIVDTTKTYNVSTWKSDGEQTLWRSKLSYLTQLLTPLWINRREPRQFCNQTYTTSDVHIRCQRFPFHIQRKSMPIVCLQLCTPLFSLFATTSRSSNWCNGAWEIYYWLRSNASWIPKGKESIGNMQQKSMMSILRKMRFITYPWPRLWPKLWYHSKYASKHTI